MRLPLCIVIRSKWSPDLALAVSQAGSVHLQTQGHTPPSHLPHSNSPTQAHPPSVQGPHSLSLVTLAFLLHRVGVVGCMGGYWHIFPSPVHRWNQAYPMIYLCCPIKCEQKLYLDRNFVSHFGFCHNPFPFALGPKGDGCIPLGSHGEDQSDNGAECPQCKTDKQCKTWSSNEFGAACYCSKTKPVPISMLDREKENVGTQVDVTPARWSLGKSSITWFLSLTHCLET